MSRLWFDKLTTSGTFTPILHLSPSRGKGYPPARQRLEGPR